MEATHDLIQAFNEKKIAKRQRDDSAFEEEKNAKRQRDDVAAKKNPNYYFIILEILLMFPHHLCPEILLSTALVSKEASFLTRLAWPYLQYNSTAYFRNQMLTVSGTISATEAKKKFKINDNDLDKVAFRTYYNKFRVQCRSFLASDVLALALIKYKGPANLRAACKTIPRKKSSAKETRRLDLEIALAEVNLVIRKDSRFCAQFINTGTPGLEEIVVTMRQMDFLHTKTRYATLLSKSIKKFKSTIREEYGWLDTNDYDDVVRYHIEEVQSTIKKNALSVLPRSTLPSFMLSLLAK